MTKKINDKENKWLDSHFIASSTKKTKSSFYIESETHVAINGLKVTKIIQYFACKMVTEMALSSKYQELQIWEDIRRISRVSALNACSFVQYKSGKHNDGKCHKGFNFFTYLLYCVFDLDRLMAYPTSYDYDFNPDLNPRYAPMDEWLMRQISR